MTIEIEGNDYKLKTDWSKISLGVFKHLMTLDYENLSEIDIFIKQISLLSDCPVEILKKCEINDLSNVMKHITVLMSSELEKVKQKEADIIFKIDKNEYALRDFNHLTLGEIGDIDALLKKEKNYYNQIENILAILIRPVIDKKVNIIKKFWLNINKKKINKEIQQYKFSEIVQRGELFSEKMMTGDVYNVISFFLSGEQICIEDMISHLLKKLMEKTQEMMGIEPKKINGVGQE